MTNNIIPTIGAHHLIEDMTLGKTPALKRTYNLTDDQIEQIRAYRDELEAAIEAANPDYKTRGYGQSAAEYVKGVMRVESFRTDTEKYKALVDATLDRTLTELVSDFIQRIGE